MSTGRVLAEEVQHCIYHRLDGNIHEFVFTCTARTAIDTCLEQFMQIWQDTLPNQRIYLLFDLSVGLPTMGYSMRRMLEVTCTYPQRPFAVIAFLHPPGGSFQVVLELINILVPDHRSVMRAFPATEQQAALRWLRHEQKRWE